MRHILFAALLSLLPAMAMAQGISNPGYPIGQIPGAQNNSSASAGNVGEYKETVVLLGAAVPFVTTNIPINVTSVTLSSGDWDVSGICVNQIETVSATGYLCWVSSTSATQPTLPNNGLTGLTANTPFANGAVYALPTGVARFSLSGTTTVYLSARASFTGSPGSAYGIIRARRVR